MAKIHTICACAARCAASTCVRPCVLPDGVCCHVCGQMVFLVFLVPFMKILKEIRMILERISSSMLEEVKEMFKND